MHRVPLLALGLVAALSLPALAAPAPKPVPTPNPVQQAAQIGFEIGQLTLKEQALVEQYKALDSQLKDDQKALAALSKAKASQKAKKGKK